MFIFLVFVALSLTVAAFTAPWPKWVFWAACLGLLGFLVPLVWTLLFLVLVVRGMALLFRATHAD